ncbi:cytochrome C oxidase subunit IV family protein [Flagellimonas pacifica]|uniref:Cytochrome C oxidase subunit IV n=1 Tax=Flagellimonas pacifica TaxID=1247520 RepID=A0A285MWK0_9FLAO|nr:cytochrome C oxidase subunit IV family protein [Allomuricauda parva]SNZ01488.1 Cytochrome C oxidase subunit IV [Allomuricauda parva]
MDRTITITWILLVVLTIITSLFSGMNGINVSIFVIVLAGFKFLGVAFQFMELKKAHLFWKIIIFAYLILFVSIILIIL